MPLAGLSKEALELLRKYDSPTVCNAIELFEVRPRDAGYTDARIQACFPEMPPMVGYASTVTMRASAPAIGDVYSTMDKQVEAFQACLGPPVVVFQDLDSPSVAATFGEVMCSVYQTFGSVGLVTSGTGRDLEQVRELGFPAFTNGTIASHGYNHMVDLGRTVHIGGIASFPNDLIHGDCNGIAGIPNDIAAREFFILCAPGTLSSTFPNSFFPCLATKVERISRYSRQSAWNSASPEKP